MKQKFFTWFTAMVLAVAIQAQVKVGDNPTTINPNAVLEIESTSKGVLLPRLTTVQRNTMANVVPGTMIYNTDVKCTEVFIGVGVPQADAMGWKNQCRANVNATFTGGTLACTGALSGDYVSSVVMTSANTKVVTINVITAGDFTASTDTKNGVEFTAAGTLATIGSNTIVLTANGIPTSTGTFTYTLSLGGQTCTFDVVYQDPPATLSGDAVDCQSGSPAAGTYTSSLVTVAGQHTKAVQVTPVSAGYYNFTTNTVNGIKFTASGVFTAGQLNTPQTVVLNASGTVAAAGTFSYTVSGTGIDNTCSFTVTANSHTGYMFAKPASQTIALNTDFSLSVLSSQDISASGTQITLKAGKTYKLQAGIAGSPSNNTSGNLDYAWVDINNNLLTAGNNGFVASNGFSGTLTHQPNATAIVTVGASDMVVKLRCRNITGSFTTDPGRSSIVVEELGSATQFLFARLNPTAQATSLNTDLSYSSLAANTLSVSGSTFTLKAGKTYRLEGAIYGQGSQPSYNADIRWVNAATNVAIASGTSNLTMNTTYSGHIPNPVSVAYITVGASDLTVKLRVVSQVNSGETLYDYRGYAIIEEITSGKDFLVAIPAGQTVNNTSAIINLTTLYFSGVSSAGTNITLKAGKTYILDAGLAAAPGSSQDLDIAWTDTLNVRLPNANTVFLISTAAGGYSGPTRGKAIIQVGSSDMVVRLKVVALNGSGNVSIDGRSFIAVKEIR